MSRPAIVVGVDPGRTGAFAVVERGVCVYVEDMPTDDNNDVDMAYRSMTLNDALTLADRVVVEDVHSMPGQGVASTFKFGRYFGAVLGCVAVLNPGALQLVRPSVWKRDMGLVGKGKDAARHLAIELFPEAGAKLARKKDVGRADAMLIAHWGGGQ